MKLISKMELMYILEAIETARIELRSAEEDGWVVTTDVWDLVAGAKKMIHANMHSSDYEVN